MRFSYVNLPTPSKKKPIQNKVNSTLSLRTALSSFHSFATKIVLGDQSKRWSYDDCWGSMWHLDKVYLKPPPNWHRFTLLRIVRLPIKEEDIGGTCGVKILVKLWQFRGKIRPSLYLGVKSWLSCNSFGWTSGESWRDLKIYKFWYYY